MSYEIGVGSTAIYVLP